MDNSKIKVLIVDDSQLVQMVLAEILEKDPGIEVVASVSGGKEALDVLDQFCPDVITLDLHMPDMDGMECLSRIMMKRPTPVLIVSKFSQKGAWESFKCLEYGAVDFVGKPGRTSVDSTISWVGDEIIQKVRACSKVNIEDVLKLSHRSGQEVSAGMSAPPVALSELSESSFLVVVGASTGGPGTLIRFLEHLDESELICPVLIAQHIPENISNDLARRMNHSCHSPVKEVENREPVRSGHIYLAKGGHDLSVTVVNQQPVLKIRDASGNNPPCIDLLMKSACKIFADRAIGVVLTGMGSDGTEGIRMIARTGGLTIAQNPETAILSSMPRAAIESGDVKEIMDVEKMPAFISRYIRKALR